jgi:hypothetical protein
VDHRRDLDYRQFDDAYPVARRDVLAIDCEGNMDADAPIVIWVVVVPDKRSRLCISPLEVTHELGRKLPEQRPDVLRVER